MEKSYRAIFEHASEMIVYVDSAGVITAVNPRIESLLGYAPTEVVGMRFSELQGAVLDHSADKVELFAATMESPDEDRCHPTGRQPTELSDIPLRHKNGRTIWTEATVVAVQNGVQPRECLGIFHDVTGRRLAEEALRENQAGFRDLLENAREAFVRVDLDGKITDANAVVEEYGLSREQLIGRRLFEFIAKDHVERAVTDFATLLSGCSVQGEMDVVTPKGIFPVEYRDNPVWRDGRVVGVQVILTDITERRRVSQLTHTLATAAMELVELPSAADPYEFIGEKVLALIGRGIVAVNSIEGDTMTVRKVAGAKPAAMNLAQKLLGRTVIDMRLHGVHEKATSDLLTGKLMRVEGGLYELFFHTVPKAVCWTLEKAIGIKECYSIGLRRPSSLFGNVTLLTQKGTSLNVGMVEAFVNQASIVLEQRKAMAALRDREAKYRLLANNASDIIWTTDLSLRLTYCSPSVERVLGYTAVEMRSLKGDEILTSASYKLVESVFAVEMEHERDCTEDPRRSRIIELEVIRKDGTRCWVEARVNFLRDAHGKAVGFVGVTRDISRRKKLEQEIQTRERRLNAFFTGATAGMALLDRNLRYIQINDMLAKMNGMPVEEHLGRTVHEVVPGLARALVPMLQKILVTGEPVLNMEVAIPTTNDSGSIRHWVLSLFPVGGRNKVPETIGVIVVETTEQKRIERQLLDSQRRLRELAARLTLAEESERRRIAVGVHDQIGQRMALMKLALQSLRAGTSETGTSSALEGICTDIDRVLDEARSLTFELSNPVLYETGFAGAVESWLAQQVHDRCGLRYTFEADNCVATLDRDTSIALFQIVRELLANVIKHAKAEHVDVRIQQADDRVRIIVRDNGVGFDPSKVGTPDSKTGGYGLFSIRERLEYLGGSLTIESVPAEGTCASVTMPLQCQCESRGKEASA